MEKASSYLEGIIYNFSDLLDNEPEFFSNKTKVVDKLSNEYALLSAFIKKRKILAVYCLQYCAVSSQLKKNEEALESARKAFLLLRSVSKLCNQF